MPDIMRDEVLNAVFLLISDLVVTDRSELSDQSSHVFDQNVVSGDDNF